MITISRQTSRAHSVKDSAKPAAMKASPSRYCELPCGVNCAEAIKIEEERELLHPWHPDGLPFAGWQFVAGLRVDQVAEEQGLVAGRRDEPLGSGLVAHAFHEGGQFPTRWQEWLAKEGLRPRVLARVSSFTDVARAVQAGHTAAVLPDLAAVDFDPKKFKHLPIADLKPRTLVLIANARSLERSGIAPGAAKKLAEILKLE